MDSPDLHHETIAFTALDPDHVSHRRPRACVKRILHAGDTLFSLFVISPLVVSHWRGTWGYMDLKGEYFPAWHSFALGSILHTALALLREPLQAEFSGPSRQGQVKSCWRTVRRFLVIKVYTYVFSISCIMHWRGGWDVMRMYLDHDVWPALTVSAICFVPLVLMKSVRNLLAPPFLILTDHKECVFSFPTRFRIQGSKQPGLYILDCMFSVLVIGSLVVFVWRGLWVLLDMELFPEDKALSAWASVLIGYGVTAVTFSLQPLMRWTCDRLTGIWRVIVADLFLFFSFIATINVWRGVWQLLDYYFLPENRLLSNWITHVASLLLLILLNCSNSVLVRGVYIDAEEPAGQCVVFPVYYIRLFFQKERTKKQKKILEALNRTEFNNVVIVDKKPNTKVEQNHQINRNLDAVPLTIVANPKSNGDHNVHENKQ
uniref:Putative conserved plasma membrane protein n=1 Tax=Culex tarsalis TaxID=7177 RepID=A0A1Q3FSF4_CULTA